jgi:menaquinone-dependent protoporphyrinogen oxidase
MGAANDTGLLVAYATKHGSTQDVAEAIAQALRARGATVDVAPASSVTSVESYTGVVLGGALYMGRWHGDALKFLEEHRHELSSKPLAIFAMGPKTLDPAAVAASRAQLDHALRSFTDLAPVSVAIVGGVVDPAKLRFPLSKMPASDARDWVAIEHWSHEVYELFVGAREAVRA